MANDETEAPGLPDDVEQQIQMQGVAAYKVSDGEVFVFTAQLLEQLLEKAKEGDGRTVVFIQSRQTV